MFIGLKNDRVVEGTNVFYSLFFFFSSCEYLSISTSTREGRTIDGNENFLIYANRSRIVDRAKSERKLLYAIIKDQDLKISGLLTSGRRFFSHQVFEQRF